MIRKLSLITRCTLLFILFFFTLFNRTIITHAETSSEISNTKVAWKEIAVGSTVSMAVKQDGTVWAWGMNNYYGLFGNGESGDQAVNTKIPLQVKGLNNVISVAVGSDHALALKKDGTVWAWGFNEVGQIGDGTQSIYDISNESRIDNNRLFAVKVKGLSNVIAIAANRLGSYAIKEDGTLWGWGDIHVIGDSVGNQSFPFEVKRFTNVAAIALGYDNLLVLKKDGTVWTTEKFQTFQFKELSNIKAIAASYEANFALKEDGTVWAWGSNSRGQLGDGTFIDRQSPIQIQGIKDVVSLSASIAGPLYLKEDGTVWANGQNGGGQLGIGSYEHSNVPVQVKGLKKITKIAASSIGFRSMALRVDGTLWSWGINYVGDGTEGTRTEPVWIKSYDTEILQSDPITVKLNEKILDFEQPPIEINDRIMVPLRKISELIGADVQWDQNTSTLTMTKGKNIINLTIGNDLAFKNGQIIRLDSPPKIINDKTFVPVRFIGESFGVTIDWDDKTKTVMINTTK